jgi:pyruvate,orthophosphate dikinase
MATLQSRTSTARKRSDAAVRANGNASSSKKRAYYFGKLKTEGKKEMRELLGGKGANLAEMTSIGLPVPPGFTITTQTCADYHAVGGKFPGGMMDEVRANVALLEKETGKHFGSASDPLLVSVRSGAAASMPGMMDTILNLGLTDRACEGLAALTGNPRFALDAYRRLINMFGDVVMNVHHDHFEAEFSRIKKKHGAKLDTDLPAGGLAELVAAYKKVYRQHTREDFPRAAAYRQINQITGLLGTGVNVQMMVFGNMGDDSGTGVAFTRDPSTGKNQFYGEFLVNAQGEDVVAGMHPHAAAGGRDAQVDARGPQAALGDQGPVGKTLPRRAGL